MYFFIRPTLKRNVERNEEICKQNAEAELKNEELKLVELQYREEINKARRDVELTELELDVKRNELYNLKDTIATSKAQAEETAEAFFQQSRALAEEKLDRALSEKAIEIQKATQAYEEDYALMLEDYVSEFVAKTAICKKEYEELSYILADLRARVSAATEVLRKEEEAADRKLFHLLHLPQEDVQEIEKLRSIIPALKNPEPLNKVIWKVYYEKPYTDLVGRVVGPSVKTGIYKITNTQNQKCYVGQARDIASRWKQHIKRGIGAEAPTRNKLYPAMLSIGVENFSFEIIEECSVAQLNEKEKYWQEFFHAQDYGYSVR